MPSTDFSTQLNQVQSAWRRSQCVLPNVNKTLGYTVWNGLSDRQPTFNPLNADLIPICHLLALLGAHHIFHVSRIRVKQLQLWIPENLCQLNFHWAYLTFRCKRQMALPLWNILIKKRVLTVLCTQEMPIDLRHNAFCIQTVGRCDLPSAPLQFYCHNNQPGTKIKRHANVLSSLRKWRNLTAAITIPFVPSSIYFFIHGVCLPVIRSIQTRHILTKDMKAFA